MKKVLLLLVVVALGLFTLGEFQHRKKLRILQEQLATANAQAQDSLGALRKEQAAHTADVLERDERIAGLQGSVDSHVSIVSELEAQLKEKEQQEGTIENLREQLLLQRNISLQWKAAYEGQVKITTEWITKYTGLHHLYMGAVKVIADQQEALRICEELSAEASKPLVSLSLGKRLKYAGVALGIGFFLGVVL